MSCTIKLNYYDDFRCLADKCHFTCCQEWAITIDEVTRAKWANIKLNAIGLGDDKYPEATLCDCLRKDGSNYVMVLDDEKKCPCLNDKKLCGLVVQLGEDSISDICRSYPRHITTYGEQKEYSLDFGCPAVIDLLHQKGSKRLVEGTKEASTFLEQVRELILEILEDTSYSLTERMMMAYYCLLDLLEQEELTDSVLDEYKDKAYLDALVTEMRQVELDEAESFWERNELFLDMESLYLRDDNYGVYLEEITGWAKHLDEYYSDLAIIEKNEVFETQYKGFETLLKDYLVAEVWASILTEETTLDDLAMVYLWIVLEYSAIKQMLFLQWLAKEEGDVDYLMVRDGIMMISRMAGYDVSDVRNALDCSFDSTLLEWGHLALLVGNHSI